MYIKSFQKSDGDKWHHYGHGMCEVEEKRENDKIN